MQGPDVLALQPHRRGGLPPPLPLVSGGEDRRLLAVLHRALGLAERFCVGDPVGPFRLDSDLLQPAHLGHGLVQIPGQLAELADDQGDVAHAASSPERGASNAGRSTSSSTFRSSAGLTRVIVSIASGWRLAAQIRNRRGSVTAGLTTPGCFVTCPARPPAIVAAAQSPTCHVSHIRARSALSALASSSRITRIATKS